MLPSRRIVRWLGQCLTVLAVVSTLALPAVHWARGHGLLPPEIVQALCAAPAHHQGPGEHPTPPFDPASFQCPICSGLHALDSALPLDRGVPLPVVLAATATATALTATFHPTVWHPAQPRAPPSLV